MSSATDVQRFDPQLAIADGHAYPGMKADPEGSWVQREDFDRIRSLVAKDEPRDNGLLKEAATDLEDYADDRGDRADAERLRTAARQLRELDAVLAEEPNHVR